MAPSYANYPKSLSHTSVLADMLMRHDHWSLVYSNWIRIELQLALYTWRLSTNSFCFLFVFVVERFSSFICSKYTLFLAVNLNWNVRICRWPALHKHTYLDDKQTIYHYLLLEIILLLLLLLLLSRRFLTLPTGQSSNCSSPEHVFYTFMLLLRLTRAA